MEHDKTSINIEEFVFSVYPALYVYRGSNGNQSGPVAFIQSLKWEGQLPSNDLKFCV